MGGLRDTLFEPSARYDVDLDSRRGLLAGVFQAGLHLVGFAALFVLAILLEVLPAGDADPISSALFWTMVLGGAGIGAGMVRLATVERVDRFWRTVAGRLLTVLVLYAAFWGLLAGVGSVAVFAGLAFVVGRLLAHLWRYRRGGD